MKFTAPKVFMLAETVTHHNGIAHMIDALGGDGKGWINKRVIPHPAEGELLIEAAGRLCYKSFEVGMNPNISKIREGNDVYIGNILKSGHGSVLEHSTVTFAFIDVSRVFTHEIVRHRAGTAFSQESLRYVRLDELSVWLPEVFMEGSQAEQFFSKTVEACEKGYGRLAELFDIKNMKKFDLKKKLTSAFRRIAPIGLATNIVVTCNHRAWRHIIEMRTSPHAEEELQLVIGQVAGILKERFPNIYQDMTESDGSWEFENSKV